MMSNFELAQEIAEQLVKDIDAARRSWLIFKVGNGLDNDDQTELHEAVYNTFAGHVFHEVVYNGALVAILALCRLTDKPSRNRRSIPKLLSLFDQETRSEVVSKARNWFEDLDSSEFSNQTASRIESRLAGAIAKSEGFLISEQIKRIRDYRDYQLAHSLDEPKPGPLINDIDWSFSQLSEIVLDYSVTILGVDRAHKQMERFQERCNREFFEALRVGLIELKDDVPDT